VFKGSQVGKSTDALAAAGKDLADALRRVMGR
jgi:hypothetical protein